MEAKLILKKTSTGFYLWRNPLDKSQEILGATVPIMNDNGVDLREYKLSLKNCEAIANGYDLDELAKSEAIKISETEVRDEKLERIYKRGFQKALELMGDKKFSSGQLLNAMDLVWQWMNGEDYGCKTLTEVQDKHIQSLQQTEWDVEIEKENVMHDYNGNISLGAKFKLDADGCLILKLKLE